MATVIGRNVQLSHTGQQLDDAIDSENAQILSTVAAVAALTPPADSEVAVTGVGRYAWISGNSDTADGVLVLNSSIALYAPGGASEGRWHLQYDGVVNFKFWEPDTTGATDVAAKLNAALASGAGEVVISEPGTYTIDSTVTVPDGVNFNMKAGTLLSYSATSGTALLIDSSQGHNEHHIRIERSSVAWFNGGADTSTIGVQVKNSDFGHFYLHRIANFHTGLQLLGDTSDGTTANTFYIGRIVNNKRGIFHKSTASGWTNQNTFIGGVIRIDSAYSSPTETGSVYIDNTETGNTCQYLNINMENDHPEYIVKVNVPWVSFIDCRWEANGAGKVQFQSGALQSRVIGGYDNWGPDAAIFDIDSAARVQIIGARGVDFYGDSAAGSPLGGPCVNLRTLSSSNSVGLRLYNQDDTIRAELNGAGDYSFYGANGKYDAADNPAGDANPKLVLKGSTGRIQIGNGTDPVEDWYLVAGTGTVRYQTAQQFYDSLWHNGTTFGVYGSGPTTQPAAIADASGGATIDAEARTALNTLLAGLRTLGIIDT